MDKIEPTTFVLDIILAGFFSFLGETRVGMLVVVQGLEYLSRLHYL
jgi:hypothetical protein